MDHKIDHKYQKLLKIPLLNTEHDTIHIPRKTIIGHLKPIEIEEFEVSNTSWTKIGTADTTKNPVELLSIPPKSSFQPEHTNTKYSIVSQGVHILQEANDGLPLLLEGNYNSIILESPMDEGRTNLFQMDILNVGLPIAHKPYPILLKYQMFLNEEIR